MNERRFIGYTPSRNQQGGEVGSSKFFLRPGVNGGRDLIERQYADHDLVRLHGEILVGWEEDIYQFANRRGLPVPRMVQLSHPLSIATELVGPSLSMLLAGTRSSALNKEEVAAMVIAVTRGADRMAEAGLVLLDGHKGNVLIWREHGLDRCKLMLDRPLFIDLGYSLVKGRPFRRPLWISSHAAHFPPEARELKRVDDSALARHLNALGFAGATLHDIVHGLRMHDSGRQRIRRMEFEQAYKHYGADQTLQNALDSGDIEPQRANQYAIGLELLPLIGQPDVAESVRRALDRMRGPLERMAATNPKDRFESLTAAADHMKACFPGDLPTQSLQTWPKIEPEELLPVVRQNEAGNYHSKKGTAQGQESAFDTFSVDDSQEDGEPDAVFHGAGLANVQGGAPHHASWNRFMTFLIAIALATLALSLRIEQTPESMLRRMQLESMHALFVKASQEGGAQSRAATQELLKLKSAPDEAVRTALEKLVNKRMAEIKKTYFSAPFVDVGGQVRQLDKGKRDALRQELAVLSRLGDEESGRWLEVLGDVAILASQRIKQ